MIRDVKLDELVLCVAPESLVRGVRAVVVDRAQPVAAVRITYAQTADAHRLQAPKVLASSVCIAHLIRTDQLRTRPTIGIADVTHYTGSGVRRRVLMFEDIEALQVGQLLKLQPG